MLDFKTLSYDSSLGSEFHDAEVKSKHLKKQIHGNVSKPLRESYPHEFSTFATGAINLLTSIRQGVRSQSKYFARWESFAGMQMLKSHSYATSLSHLLRHSCIFDTVENVGHAQDCRSGFHDGEVKSKHLKKQSHGNVSKPLHESYPHGESSYGIPEKFTTAKFATPSFVTPKGSERRQQLEEEGLDDPGISPVSSQATSSLSQGRPRYTADGSPQLRQIKHVLLTSIRQEVRSQRKYFARWESFAGMQMLKSHSYGASLSHLLRHSCSYTVASHASISPNIIPSDNHQFGHLKLVLQVHFVEYTSSVARTGSGYNSKKQAPTKRI
ncbi:unnamed protein product [Darwinula stevensoni]|uniref:Uncharacterized protein n=1 Tax=Darwinula stevensoni TaxID=69355 RepID=A0A7R9FQF7_9CRUS|nr:unnamed protein product [Darwinula stevensoni]CAG0899090.1 unnamed protein product [Darwinula stevensoni]